MLGPAIVTVVVMFLITRCVRMYFAIQEKNEQIRGLEMKALAFDEIFKGIRHECQQRSSDVAGAEPRRDPCVRNRIFGPERDDF